MTTVETTATAEPSPEVDEKKASESVPEEEKNANGTVQEPVLTDAAVSDKEETTAEKPEDDEKNADVKGDKVEEKEDDAKGKEEPGEGKKDAGEGKEGDADGEKIEETEEGFETPEEGEGVEGEKLDDDQDIENPAYIPKTGKYYMHDSREDTSDGLRDEKKSRADGMWSRDRFDERYQQPRTRRHLVDKYGFDIRLGETVEIAEAKEKEMRDAGISLEDEDLDNYEKKGREGGNRGRGGQRRPPPRRSNDEDGENRGRNDEDEDVRPAARRDRRDDGRGRGGMNRGGRGEERSFNRNGDGGSMRGRDGGGNRGGEGRGGYRRGGGGGYNDVRAGGFNDRGGDRSERGASQRQFNRTFNNSNRNSNRRGDDVRDGGAPKRYSTQRNDKNVPPTSSSDQPTDIVYFDPTKQTPRDNRPVREKKPLDIVPPPS